MPSGLLSAFFGSPRFKNYIGRAAHQDRLRADRLKADHGVKNRSPTWRERTLHSEEPPFFDRSDEPAITEARNKGLIVEAIEW